MSVTKWWLQKGVNSNDKQEPVAVKVIDDRLSTTNTPQDGPALDAFSRQRTSGTGQRLDVEFIYDKQDDYFDETTSNGTVTFNSNTRDLTLSLSDAVDGSYACMRSHPVPYTPGNSQLPQ